MSAHHAFGARSWRAPALIGATLVLAALALGAGLESVLRAFPLPILAALLLVAGITHIGLLGDLKGRAPWSIALTVGAVGAAGYLLAGVLIGLALAGVVRLVRRPPRATGRRAGQPARQGGVVQ